MTLALNDSMTNPMRLLRACAIAGLMSGCVAAKRQGISHIDEYDSVKIDQMVGNHVSGRVFERTIVCLNARRETRQAPTVTNQTVTWLTNVSLMTVTNQTVTVVTNQSRTVATNEIAQPAPAPTSVTATNEPTANETNQVAVPAIQPGSSTNQSVTIANNQTLSKAGNQIVSTVNNQTLQSRQVTITTNNLSLTIADNQAISAETNVVISTLTNQFITAGTNQTVLQPDGPLQEYFLYAESTPPPDFVLYSGESLVLLIDGVRHGFAPATSQTAFVPRKGFTSSLYKVSAEILVDIAHAKHVKIRLRGANSVIEKEMNRESRNNFKKFVAKYSVSPSTP